MAFELQNMLNYPCLVLLTFNSEVVYSLMRILLLTFSLLQQDKLLNFKH